jgi:hypothetical protein
VRPYREPGERPLDTYRVEGSELVVTDGARLAPVCLHCGAKKDVVFDERKLQAVQASYGYGAIGGVVGSAMSQAAKIDVLMTMLIGAGAAGVLGLIVWLVTKPKPGAIIQVALPTCIRCQDRFRASQGRARVWGLVGLGLLVLLGVAAAAKSLVIVVPAAILTVGVFVFISRERKNQSKLATRFVANGWAHLTLVDARALEFLSAPTFGRPKKKSKTKKRRKPVAELPAPPEPTPD